MVELKYKKFDKSIVTLEQMRSRAIINALCSTKSISKAAFSIDVPESTVKEFMRKYNIKSKHLKEMRKDYKSKILRNGNKARHFNTEKE